MSQLLRSRSHWPFALALVCLSGCHLLNLNPPAPDKAVKEAGPAAPGKYAWRVSQFVFLSDFPLKHDLPLFHELAGLPTHVYTELKLPASSVPVQVYLFEDRDHYEHFMRAKYPELPKRRAFFVVQPHRSGEPEDLLVYTYWGDRIQEDLRHELTHALLHSVLKDVPLWLDEGLAEYFEVPADWKGTHYQHLNQIRLGAPFKPDLARLEQLKEVQQMSPAEYREAWAWVHLMLRDKPEARAVLLDYLQQLRVKPDAGLLRPGLVAVFPQLNQALEEHLARLDSGTNPSPTAQR